MSTKKVTEKKIEPHDKEVGRLKQDKEKQKQELINEDSHLKEIDCLKQEIEKLKQELNEKNDKLLRSYADLQNYQKRIAKEIECSEEEARNKYLLEIVDLYELLQKAYENSNPKDGIQAIIQNIQHLMEIEQIKPIDSLGRPFDRYYHYAISTVEKNDAQDGQIVDEIKKGYMVGNRVLRPSKVVVAKNKNIIKKEGE